MLNLWEEIVLITVYRNEQHKVPTDLFSFHIRHGSFSEAVGVLLTIDSTGKSLQQPFQQNSK